MKAISSIESQGISICAGVHTTQARRALIKYARTCAKEIAIIISFSSLLLLEKLVHVKRLSSLSGDVVDTTSASAIQCCPATANIRRRDGLRNHSTRTAEPLKLPFLHSSIKGAFTRGPLAAKCPRCSSERPYCIRRMQQRKGTPPQPLLFIVLFLR